MSFAWEGVTTLAELFERACRERQHRLLLGTRVLISTDIETSHNSRTFEKFHLVEYQWLTYGNVFESVCSFVFSLAVLGHLREKHAAIFLSLMTPRIVVYALQSEVRDVILVRVRL
ncbi:hypothetical protein RJT34_16515 [Clitoria ternatea]|uniref:Uncharacterized protein n=1 Tax=Clitoria ternatea TaxID=43366 RepID=A0AAN9PCD6_CLITE